ncbi:MAG: hypothetical protein ACRCWG_11535 [Sarcina sp.]
MAFLPTIMLVILGVIGFIILTMIATFIYMQAVLGVCEIVNNGKFKDAMTMSWSGLFKNIQFFVRTSLITFPVTVVMTIGLVGVFTGLFLVMLVQPEIGMAMIIIMIIAILVAVILAMVLLPKLIGVCYMAYSIIDEEEKKKYEDLRFE